MKHNKMHALISLMRLNKPVGLFLLFWPVLWSWCISCSNQMIHVDILIIFTLGIFFMRSAGCIINDYIDSNIDSLVQRTNNRPLACGIISKSLSKILFTILIFISFLLVLYLDLQVILLSSVVLVLTIIYPYTKRFCYYPQVFLGIVYSLSIPMMFLSVNKKLCVVCYLLFLMNFFWTIAYDTQYAMIDRSDDVKIGVKSTAILFGRFDKLMIGCLQFLVCLLLFIIGCYIHLKYIFYVMFLGVVALFIYQQILIVSRSKNKCFLAFLNNNYIGILIFLGIFFS